MGIGPIPVAAAFTAGVLAVHALAQLPSVAALALLAVPALLPWRGRALWAAAALGVLYTAWRAQPLLEARWPAARHGEEVDLEAVVSAIPEAAGAGLRLRLDPLDAAWPRHIRASWFRGAEPLAAGDCRRFTLRLRAPHGSLNPGGFDYEGWLFRERIGATASVRDAAPCATPPPAAPLLRLRQRIVDRLAEALPEHPALPMLAALIIGEQSAFSADDWETFRATGTSHLVAISGFNIAIVAGVAFFLGRWLWALWPRLCLTLPAQRAGMLVSALLAGAYALLAGFEPPVQRAVLMVWIVLAAAWTGRLTHPARVLALAWLALLLLDPFAVLAPGLWLSFGAVAAIFYVSLGRLEPPGFWHAAVLLQLMIAIALAPLTLHFFHGASWIAPLVNLVAVPLFTVITPWALVALLVHFASPGAGFPLLLGAASVLEQFSRALAWVATWPALWLAAAPPAGALGLAVLGVVLLFAPRGLPLRPLGVLCLLPALLAAPDRPRGGFEVTALDVGQGLAVVVRTASHTLVYDTGPAFEDGFDAGAAVVAPYLLHRGWRDVELLVISHGDNDHAGGAPAVRRLLRVQREVGADCRDGQRWEWDGVRFEVLHPDDGGWAGNDGSCVLRVDGRFSVLLAGDIEASAERRLLRARADRLAADVLVAPHHGSRTSSTPAFVAAVRPRVVLYGAGWRNHFRHPRAEVVERYAALRSRQFITGHGGAVILWQDGDELRAEEYRRTAARFWNAPAD